MKKLLLSVLLIGALGIFSQTQAQCTISDLKVNLISVNTNTCEVILDFTWTQEINSGNKFAYVHLWTQGAYHTPAPNWVNMYSGPSKYPVAADLINALATIVINDNSSATPTIGAIYHPDNAHIPQTAGLTVTKVPINGTSERMTVQNIKLTLPSCATLQTLKFDAWASQSANGRNVHCAVQNGSLVINEVRPSGLIFCSNPRQYQVNIFNNGPAINNVSYTVRLDYNPVGIINATDTLIYTSGLINLPANATWTSGILGYMPYSGNYVSSGRPLLVEVTVPLRPNTSITQVQNSCGPLAVKFAFFTATQQKGKTVLNWQTAFEQNNRGFEVQRKLATGDYETIAFVPSRAIDGNSNLTLNYSYNDHDNLAAVKNVFYRLKQLDFDGKTSFSEIRVIKNEAGQTDVFIYPNPSREVANLIMPSGTGSVDLLITDLNGSTIRRVNSITADRYPIRNLNPGMYMVKIYVTKTGETLVKKLVVL